MSGAADVEGVLPGPAMMWAVLALGTTNAEHTET